MQTPSTPTHPNYSPHTRTPLTASSFSTPFSQPPFTPYSQSQASPHPHHQQTPSSLSTPSYIDTPNASRYSTPLYSPSSSTSTTSNEPISCSKQAFRLLRRSDLLLPVVEEDAKVRTNRGAILSILAFFICFSLAFKSIYHYTYPSSLAPKFKERTEVDTQLNAKLPIYLNITFFHLSCLDIELVALDVAGESQIDISTGDLKKIRISPTTGQVLGSELVGHVNRDKLALIENRKSLPILACGSCYGAELFEGDCCNTCQDVKSRYQDREWDVYKIQREAEQCLREMDHPEIEVQKGEGCILEGKILVNKVAGNIHVALGSTRKIGEQVIHTFVEDQLGNFDTSHEITSLRFGGTVFTLKKYTH